MKKVSIFLLMLAMVFAFAGCQTAPEAPETPETPDSYSIGIIQFVEHVALDAARDGFIDALMENGYEDGVNINIDLQNAQADQSNLATISDKFISDQADLILAIATPAAQAIAGKTTEIPILGTAITDYEIAKLLDTNEAPGANVSGTSDMNPVADQIDLLVQLAPEVQTIGVLYSSSEDNSILQAQLAKDAVEALGLTYVEATVSSSNDVQQAAQSLVDQCDAIYLPTDNIMASSMPIIYGATIDTKTPVICGERGMAEAGGLATIGLDYYDLGYQTGLMAVQILEGEAETATMPIEFASDLYYYINGDIADELEITIPDDLAEYVVYADTEAAAADEEAADEEAADEITADEDATDEEAADEE